MHCTPQGSPVAQKTDFEGSTLPRRFFDRGLVIWIILFSFGSGALAVAESEEAKPAPAKTEDAATPDDSGITWQPSFEAAVAAAKKESRPIMVDFWTTWCGFCKKLDRETYGDESVIRFVRDRLISVKVDGDKRADLRTRYGVEGYPTILFLSPSGAEIKRIVGFRPPEAFLSEASKAIQSSADMKKFSAAAAESPDDADAQRVYARALFAAGNGEEAVQLLEAFLKRHPDASGVHLDLGDMYRAAGKAEEAARHFEKVVDTTSGDQAAEIHQASLALARTRIALKQTEGAVKVLDRLLAKEITARVRLEGLFLRAFCHARLKDAASSIADLRAAETVDPDGVWGLRASLIRDVVTPRERS